MNRPTTWMRRAFSRHPNTAMGVATALGIVAMMAGAATLGDGALGQLTLWLIESLLALSLILVWGHAGIFSLGQSALYGIGAYAFGVVAINLTNAVFLPWALLGAACIAGLTSGVIGYFVFYGRVSQLSVSIITLAFTMVAFAVLNSLADPKYAIGTAVLGGYNGMVGIPLFRLGGAASKPLTAPQVFLTVGTLVVILTAAVALVLRSPFGRVIAATRSNDNRAELLGIDVRRYRLVVFVLGGILAGIGGGLYAGWSSFVSPGLFSLQPAVLVIIWVLVGGRSNILGAIVGTLIVEGLTSWLGGSQGQYSPIYLGIALILVVLFAPNGLLGTLQSWTTRLPPASPPDTESHQAGEESTHLAPSAILARLVDGPGAAQAGETDRTLTVSGLRKTFGGFTAVDGVDLEFPPRSIQCIIGPNGAGKSTLFALLVGIVRPTTGQINFGGRRLNRIAPFRRAHLGIGIKLQTASVFYELSARENLWIAAYSLYANSKRANFVASNLLEAFGLEADSDEPANILSHGEQQWLEIAMVAARRPSVLLLDEPTAGMSAEETSRTAALVKSLATTASVVVIEHDMAFVRQLNAPTTVLHLGRQLMAGTLENVQASDEVRQVYLGSEAHVEA